MSDQEDIDALAAEYVLGTLSPAERTAVSARRLRERDLDAAIEAWEARLAPLSDTAPAIAPSPGLLGEIEARLAGGGEARHRLAPPPCQDPFAQVTAADDEPTHW